MNKNMTTRRRLLGTASAIALSAPLIASNTAYAADADRPVLWIEGGWHFEDVGGKNEQFVPPLDAATVANGFPSITSFEDLLGFSYGADGTISFQPENSDWVFSASIRYGRAHGYRHKRIDKQITGPRVMQYHTPGGKHLKSGQVYMHTPYFSAYADETASNSLNNTILDFAAGKDVGLGLFGHRTDSVISFGARYARLHTETALKANVLPYAVIHLIPNPVFHGKYAFDMTHYNSASTLNRQSAFQGIGPSLSWSNSTPLAGNLEDGELAFDWGANAALLFGRQKTHVQHKSTANYFAGGGQPNYILTRSVPGGNHRTNSRRITVPNAGGFAGISYRFSDAKLSLGYRVDYFFGALDGGIDKRHDITTSFNGPYASISIGLGD